MFGFFNPGRSHRGYRSNYARLCQHFRAQNSQSIGILHSFETTLLYSMAVDAKLFDTSCVPDQVCCRGRRLSNSMNEPDAAVAEYCSNAALLLIHTKLQDDINDEAGIRKLMARLALSVWNKHFEKSKAYFNRVQPALLGTIEKEIGIHHELETRNSLSISMAEYVVPTGECFGQLFKGLALLEDREDLAHDFYSIGNSLGKAIIAFDCAVDWRKDKARKHFNLVTNDSERSTALELACEYTKQVSLTAKELFGEDSVTATAALQVKEHLLEFASIPDAEPTLRRWLTRRIKRIVQIGKSLGKALIAGQRRASDGPFSSSTAYCDPCCIVAGMSGAACGAGACEDVRAQPSCKCNDC